MKKIKNLTQEDYKELSQKLNSLKKRKSTSSNGEILYKKGIS